MKQINIKQAQGSRIRVQGKSLNLYPLFLSLVLFVFLFPFSLNLAPLVYSKILTCDAYTVDPDGFEVVIGNNAGVMSQTASHVLSYGLGEIALGSHIIKVRACNYSYGTIAYASWANVSGNIYKAAWSNVGPINTINSTPTAGGTGYTLNDVLTVIGGSSGTVTATGVTDGVVTEITLTTAGTGYTPGSGLTTSGGTGADCSIEITDVNAVLTAYGSISSINSTPAAGGTGYTLNDVLTLQNGLWNATVIASGVTDGVVTAVTLSDPGADYSVTSAVTTSGGTGSGCTVEITGVSFSLGYAGDWPGATTILTHDDGDYETLDANEWDWHDGYLYINVGEAPDSWTYMFYGTGDWIKRCSSYASITVRKTTSDPDDSAQHSTHSIGSGAGAKIGDGAGIQVW